MSVTKVLFDDRIKQKNVLALNEKVAAIREYELDPVYKRVARIFNCSPDQIKRIVKQKNEIMAEWENRTKKPSVPKSHESKPKKVWALGTAVYEWIRRIMYYTDFNLNDMLIQTMSIEFAKALKFEKFHPTKEWIANFRSTFELPDANTKTMSFGYQESQSVQIRDILRYVKDLGPKGILPIDDSCSSQSPKITLEAERSSDMEIVDIDEVKLENINPMETDIVMKTEEPDDRFLVKEEPSISLGVPVSIESETTSTSLPLGVTSPATGFDFGEIKSEISEEKPIIQNESATEIKPEPTEIKQQKTSTEPESDDLKEEEEIAIYSHKAAIACVKLLEEFALLKENFRLIGLIERLEEALNSKS